jgi:hypothetical protein
MTSAAAARPARCPLVDEMEAESVVSEAETESVVGEAAADSDRRTSDAQ